MTISPGDSKRVRSPTVREGTLQDLCSAFRSRCVIAIVALPDGRASDTIHKSVS